MPLKRLSYVSKFARPLSAAEIDSIAQVSIENNRRLGITGVLISLSGMFFQTIEGEPEAVDQLYAKIHRDDRHNDILSLKVERDVAEREFPEWSMKTIVLDEQNELLVRPIKNLFQTVAESHRILERYTQPTILRLIDQGTNPLTMRPRRVERIILFSDIVSFSTLSERLDFEALDLLVSRYFTVCTTIISAHAGEIAKLTGDGLMAYFDASEADAALAASVEILRVLAELRAGAPEDSPLKVLYAGVGLSHGTVIEGNIGSGVKIDYTILGDAVNTAARLEGLSRKHGRGLICSRDVMSRAAAGAQFVPLGSQQLKGRAEPVEIFSLDDPATVMPSSADMGREIEGFLSRLG